MNDNNNIVLFRIFFFFFFVCSTTSGKPVSSYQKKYTFKLIYVIPVVYRVPLIYNMFFTLLGAKYSYIIFSRLYLHVQFYFHRLPINYL